MFWQKSKESPEQTEAQETPVHTHTPIVVTTTENADLSNNTPYPKPLKPVFEIVTSRNGYVEIPPNHVGLVTFLGSVTGRVLGPGPHIVLPRGLNKVYVVDMGLRPINPPEVTLASKDSVVKINMVFSGLPLYPDIIAFRLAGGLDIMLQLAVMGTLGKAAGSSTTEELVEQGPSGLIALIEQQAAAIARSVGVKPVDIKIESIVPTPHIAKAIEATYAARKEAEATAIRMKAIADGLQAVPEELQTKVAQLYASQDNQAVIMIGGENDADRALALAATARRSYDPE